MKNTIGNFLLGEYETLGGLILAYTEDLPHPGETCEQSQHLFSIQATHHNRIDTIKMTLEHASQELYKGPFKAQIR